MMAYWAWGECGSCDFVGDMKETKDEGVLLCAVCGFTTELTAMPEFPSEGKVEHEAGSRRKDKYGAKSQS